MTIKKLKKAPKVLYPFPVELAYRKGILNLVFAWKNEITHLIIPRLAGWLSESESQKKDAWAEDINSVMNDLSLTIGRHSEEFLNLKVPEYARGTNKWNNKQWVKVVNSVLGIDIVKSEPWLGDQLVTWVNENSGLIKDLQGNTLKEVNNVLNQGILQGQKAKTIENRLLSEAKLKSVGASPYDSSVSALRKAKNRAKLIADDQIGKLNSQLTENRQTDLGLLRYRWRNVKDIRVRGNPSGLYPDTSFSHWDREGIIYSWDSPPLDGHPGYAIRCRCFADPVFEDVVDMDKSTSKQTVLKDHPTEYAFKEPVDDDISKVLSGLNTPTKMINYVKLSKNFEFINKESFKNLVDQRDTLQFGLFRMRMGDLLRGAAKRVEKGVVKKITKPIIKPKSKPSSKK